MLIMPKCTLSIADGTIYNLFCVAKATPYIVEYRDEYGDTLPDCFSNVGTIDYPICFVPGSLISNIIKVDVGNSSMTKNQIIICGETEYNNFDRMGVSSIKRSEVKAYELGLDINQTDMTYDDLYNLTHRLYFKMNDLYVTCNTINDVKFNVRGVHMTFDEYCEKELGIKKPCSQL